MLWDGEAPRCSVARGGASLSLRIAPVARDPADSRVVGSDRDYVSLATSSLWMRMLKPACASKLFAAVQFASPNVVWKTGFE